MFQIGNHWLEQVASNREWWQESGKQVLGHIKWPLRGHLIVTVKLIHKILLSINLLSNINWPWSTSLKASKIIISVLYQEVSNVLLLQLFAQIWGYLIKFQCDLDKNRFTINYQFKTLWFYEKLQTHFISFWFHMFTQIMLVEIKIALSFLSFVQDLLGLKYCSQGAILVAAKTQS